MVALGTEIASLFIESNVASTKVTTAVQATEFVALECVTIPTFATEVAFIRHPGV